MARRDNVGFCSDSALHPRRRRCRRLLYPTPDDIPLCSTVAYCCGYLQSVKTNPNKFLFLFLVVGLVVPEAEVLGVAPRMIHCVPYSSLLVVGISNQRKQKAQPNFCFYLFFLLGLMVPDAEVLSVACEILSALPIGQFQIKLNHRR